jgi:ABC-type transporter Mla subunit MlaD
METTLLTIILAVQTTVLAFAVIHSARTWRRIQETTSQLNDFVQSVRPRTMEILDGMNDFVKTIQPVGEQLVDISMNLKDILETARGSTADIADFLKDTTDAARQQVSRVDNLLTETVKKAEIITSSVTNNLLNPLAEISALFKGFRTAFSYFRGDRNRKEVHQAIADEEMFI